MLITAPNPNQAFLSINDLNNDCFLQVAEQLNGDVCDALRVSSTCQVLYRKISSIKIPLYKICLKSIAKEEAKQVAERMSQMHVLRCNEPRWPPGPKDEDILKYQAQREQDQKLLREAYIEKSQPLVKRKLNLSAQLAIEIKK
jgi:hypothetical protein